MTITKVLAGIPVEDMIDALEFYERLFGRGPDARPISDVSEWKLPAGGWVQVVTDADRAGSGALTLIVEDIAEELGRLGLYGLSPVAKSVGDFFKTAKFRDPSGNRITLSQPPVGTY